MSGLRQAGALACANIALAKYWGKSDAELNLPAVPSVSVTLDALVTETKVEFDSAFEHDVMLLDGRESTDSESRRAIEIVDLMRQRAGVRDRVRVHSANRFPTASGLASSASGFAALVAATARALQLDLTIEQLSAYARRGSASAARSLMGGFVELPAGVPGDDALAARQIADENHWDIAVVIALATLGAKKIGSRDAMTDTARTSPYYAAWVAVSPAYAREVREGILARDLVRVGETMEASTYAMHACALATRPAIRYTSAATITLLDAVASLRAQGVGAWATMDAGPHVKVLCARADADRVHKALTETQSAVEVRIARPGPGIRWM